MMTLERIECVEHVGKAPFATDKTLDVEEDGHSANTSRGNSASTARGKESGFTESLEGMDDDMPFPPPLAVIEVHVERPPPTSPPPSLGDTEMFGAVTPSPKALQLREDTPPLEERGDERELMISLEDASAFDAGNSKTAGIEPGGMVNVRPEQSPAPDLGSLKSSSAPDRLDHPNKSSAGPVSFDSSDNQHVVTGRVVVEADEENCLPALSARTETTVQICDATQSMMVNLSSEPRRRVSNSSVYAASGLKIQPLPPPGKESPVQRCLEVYSKLLDKCPMCFFFCYVIVIVLIIILAWKPLEVQEDFSAFIKADGVAMRRQDAYAEALEVKKQQQSRRLQAQNDANDDIASSVETLGLQPLLLDNVAINSKSDAMWLHELNQTRNGRLLQSSSSYSGGDYVVLLRTFTIIYMPKNGNAFDSVVLRAIRDFEASLRSAPKWRGLCDGWVITQQRPSCNPGESISAYTFPRREQPTTATVNQSAFSFVFDAQGQEQLPIPAVIYKMQRSNHIPTHNMASVLPKSYVAATLGSGFNSNNAAPPVALRSKFTFALLMGSRGTPSSVIRRNVDTSITQWEEFVEKELYPALDDRTLAKGSGRDTKVYYHGDHLSSYEVTQTLKNDSMLAIGALAFVLCHLWLHTRSLIISICSLCIIFTSIPLSYVLTPSASTTVASFMSLFLVTGIGCDVIFVCTDFWSQSILVEKRRPRRITWTILHAGQSCLATSLTTAASFLANLLSALQPLREFGLFMGLCVMGAYVLILLLLPPLLIKRDTCCKRRNEKDIQVEDDESLTQNVLAVVPVGASPISRTEKRHRMTGTQRLLLGVARMTASRPRAIVVGTALLALASAIGVCISAELDRQVPELFPEDHNQVQNEKAQEHFLVTRETVIKANNDPPLEGGQACLPNASVSSSACLMYWCDATTNTSIAETDNDITCLRPDNQNISCAVVDLQVRLASDINPMPGAWRTAFPHAVKTWTHAFVASQVYQASNPELKKLMAEDWETGALRSIRYFDMGTVTAIPYGNAVTRTGTCVVDTICMPGRSVCNLPGWTRLGSFTFNASGGTRRLSQHRPATPKSRALQANQLGITRALQVNQGAASNVPLSKRIDVTVVWGIRAARSTPLVGAPAEIWSFDPTYEAGNPWAQRAMLLMCTDMPANLLVIQKQCWIELFKTWLTDSQGLRFPSRDFDNQVNSWWSTSIKGADNIWRDGIRVQAAKLSFILNLRNDIGAEAVMDHRKLWDDYVDRRNAAASLTANHAFHTTTTWVRAEAEIEVIDSTISTIILAAVCAFGGMLVFTCDPALACTVLALIIGIVCALAFFMAVPMNWKLGSIEVISLVIFVGYSVTYSLHMAHSYAAARTRGFDDSDNEDDVPDSPGRKKVWAEAMRKERSRMALIHIGGAILSSAVSTVGVSFFLLFCTMIIFVKLGAVVIAVTFLSISCALISLPAALVLVGPAPEPFTVRFKQFVRARF